MGIMDKFAEPSIFTTGENTFKLLYGDKTFGEDFEIDHYKEVIKYGLEIINNQVNKKYIAFFEDAGECLDTTPETFDNIEDLDLLTSPTLYLLFRKIDGIFVQLRFTLKIIIEDGEN
jgi:hypothetical protein